MQIPITFVVAALLAALVTSFAEARELDTVPPYPIWPIPREAEIEKDRLLLVDACIVVPEGDERAQYPGRLLSELIQDEFLVAVPVAAGKAPEGAVPILVGTVESPLISDAAGRRATPEDPGPEGYYMKIDADGALIAGCDYRGALYGVSSFIQLVHKWGKQSVAVRKGEVRDWPFLPYRWVHVYIPGKEALPFARRYMRDFLLRYKFNGMIMEVGGGMRFDSHPEINVGWERTVREWYAHGETIKKSGEGIPLGPANRFAASCHFGVAGGSYIEKDDLRHLRDAAETYGLEIVPEIQSLSHSYYIACARRDLAEMPEMAWPDSYCPSNPESYKVLFDIMDEYIDVLEPTRVHIGHDEWRAGAFCPRCKGKDTGELFARDVLKIHEYLKGRGIETWMWGDHFVDWHNRFGRGWSEGTVVRYEKPDTEAARDIIAAQTSDIHITNWSGPRGDEVFRKLGWKFIVGNMRGTGEENWAERVRKSGLLGGEISSWCALDEFELAKLNIAEAAYSINLLWATDYPEKEDAAEEMALLMPKIRARLAADPPVSAGATPMRFEVMDIKTAFNHPPKGEDWDLTGLSVGDGFYNGVPYRIGDPAQTGGANVVRVSRLPGIEGKPMEAALPIRGRWAALIFFHSATDKGRRTIHAGDATHFPRESSELIGFYEIRWADGLVTSHPIRWDETVAEWDCGLSRPYYFTRAIVCGRLPDGRKAVIWGSEWTNPRPDVPIESVKMVGAPGLSSSEPLLFGVTAVEKPRVEDYR